MCLCVDGMMLMKHSNLSKRDSRCLMNCIVIIVTLVPIATSGQSVVASFTHPSSGEQWDCYENITASSSICTACTVALSDSFGYNVTILWQNPPNPPFQLEANGIQWILKTPAFKIIDRETTSNFTFRFNATKGVSAIQSEVLTVVIKDINDNYPKFTNDAYELTIYNSLAEGTILTMQASDADESPTITYSITAGDANKTFSIDPHTGQLNLTTSSNLNATTKPTYNLTVQASDWYKCQLHYSDYTRCR
ncbi:hypothetical protein DPMN_151316 [Dreissena polymorpha]|uniref:Cadherin domain-containing protein n=1 Tax=Dreissena polymorpha TaxID=45954 RepID=A0A9D4FJP7_DREPO|nr:hypothetical protein DPMN_151316 [Dreissena polymorpha]